MSKEYPTHTSDVDPVTPEEKELKIPFVPYLLQKNQLLMPKGHLPLILTQEQEKRAIDNALMRARYIAVLQQNNNLPADNAHELDLKSASNLPLKSQLVGKSGCVGRITTFTEQEDKSYFIIIEGIKRFDVKDPEIIDRDHDFIEVDYQRFYDEQQISQDPLSPHLKRKLFEVLKPYLKRYEMEIDQTLLYETKGFHLLNALTMACPLSNLEKQALLEEPNLERQVAMLTAFMEITLKTDISRIPSIH